MIIYDSKSPEVLQWFHDLPDEKRDYIQGLWNRSTKPNTTPEIWYLEGHMKTAYIKEGKTIIQYTPPNYIDWGHPWCEIKTIEDFISVPFVNFYFKFPTFQEFRFRDWSKRPIEDFNLGSDHIFPIYTKERRSWITAHFAPPEYPSQARFATIWGNPEQFMIREREWGTKMYLTGHQII